MATTRRAQAEETRLRVLTAARLLFAERGYHATGTHDIVQAAQVGTRGALYHHFADKRALFAAVFEAVEEDLLHRAGAADSAGSGFERLRLGLLSFLDASLEGEIRQILLIDGPAVLGWAEWRDIESRYGLGAIESLLQDGIADGSIRPTESDALAHLLLSAVDEAALFIAHARDPQLARDHAAAGLDALLSGLPGMPADSPAL